MPISFQGNRMTMETSRRRAIQAAALALLAPVFAKASPPLAPNSRFPAQSPAEDVTQGLLLAGKTIVFTGWESGTGGNTLFVADARGVVRARVLAKRLDNAPLAIVDKRRERAGESEVMNIIGDVEGKTCVLVDDMIDTAGTICGAAEALMNRGAARVVVAATHPVLSGPACERLAKSAIDTVVVTNTMPIPDACDCAKIEVVSIAPIVASTMKAIFEDESVSELFDDRNQ